MKPFQIPATVATAGVLLLVISACGSRVEYTIEEVRVSQPSWDSARVEVDFVRRASLGRSQNVVPDELSLLAFNSDYDTLYYGHEGGFAFPDRQLGSREPVILEVCGSFHGRWICDQKGVRASPKRLVVNEGITYPMDDSFDRGSYDLEFRVERQTPDGSWENIEFDGTISGYIEASVEGAIQSSVRIPFTVPRGRFDLTRLDNYNDFRFYLDSRLMDEQEARVAFTIYGGLNGDYELLARTSRTLSAVTAEEREANVRGFARQAGRRMVDELSAFLGGRRSVAYVSAWNYERDTEQYRIDMELVWRGSFFDNREYRIEGELRVGDDGRNAYFRLSGGNRAGLDRWDRRVPGNAMDLGDLAPDHPTGPYRPGRRSY